MERYRAYQEDGSPPNVFEVRGDIWLRVVAHAKNMADAEMIAVALNQHEGAVSLLREAKPAVMADERKPMGWRVRWLSEVNRLVGGGRP